MNVNGAAAKRPRKAAFLKLNRIGTPASMGPRPNGRGKGQIPCARGIHAWRQWGRGQTAAESCRTIKESTLRLLASMGPRPNGRGKVACGVGGGLQLTASMGPRPNGRGKP